MAGSDGDRITAWGHQLAQAHSRLRQQLRDLAANLGSAQLDGGVFAHCLAFCAALSAHHQGEDTGMFGDLLRVRPDLHSTVRKLTEDHQMIAGIMSTVRDLTTEAAHASPQRREAISRELDGLAAIMESHFRYEERALGSVLDQGIQDSGWATAVFQFKL